MKFLHTAFFSVALNAFLFGEVVQLVEQVSPSVVSLKVETDDRVYTGSGFFVDGDGVVATNYHVIEGGRKITAKTKSGLDLFCKGVLTVSEDYDLALLKFASKNQVALPLGKPDMIKQGEGVVVIGSPHGLEQTVSDGIVSAIREEDGWNVIQVTAPISKGSSGSPVVNRGGEVIGVATFNIKNSQNLNFASSVKHLSLLVDSIDQLEILSLEEVLPRRTAPATVTESSDLPPKATPELESTADVDVRGGGLRDFWRDYWASMDLNNADRHLTNYSNVVDYQYIKGQATKDQIKKGFLEFYEKFPRRSYHLLDEPVIIPLDDNGNRVGFDFSFTYNYSGGAKPARGKAFVELALQYTSNGWKIYKFRERVEKQ